MFNRPPRRRQFDDDEPQWVQKAYSEINAGGFDQPDPSTPENWGGRRDESFQLAMGRVPDASESEQDVTDSELKRLYYEVFDRLETDVCELAKQHKGEAELTNYLTDHANEIGFADNLQREIAERNGRPFDDTQKTRRKLIGTFFGCGGTEQGAI